MPPRKSTKASAAATSTSSAPTSLASSSDVSAALEPKAQTKSSLVEKSTTGASKKKMNGNGHTASTPTDLKTSIASSDDAGKEKLSAPAAAATTSALKPETVHPDRSLIEFRAWEIWVSEGCPQGRDLENWLQAEREVIEAIGY
ncbi:MAG: DUF2934 domain-containing protein [Bdellovibrionota bacterium]